MSAYAQPVLAIRSGVVAAIDNRRLANIAKLAGAPGSASAGLDCWLRIGDGSTPASRCCRSRAVPRRAGVRAGIRQRASGHLRDRGFAVTPMAPAPAAGIHAGLHQWDWLDLASGPVESSP
jgi:hypothetical protein